ncbi:MAG: ribonuclease R [Lactococcus raffinolactis]|jgi:ribonuclease R|uniref:Ribonuclease R n=1 Tax=Pseudolactococcus raffinolactis TaxID=1366 RepID=A0A6H0U8W8_9LACT|nr:ribonuclease R [Lactococcus raffinolactis]MBR2542919.1 ribonuclease R [Lactococcus sp.]MDN5493804.1 ribonuclease R [Lactococcus raffinolactis]MDN5579041.1 ribonuclease R [Lactococcus raffinolactis]MDN6083207.1 ribonuclease R [Lactococcus raffinolactis]MDN6087090.1 ribonuclease R [Lactococcus raffinolactis]
MKLSKKVTDFLAQMPSKSISPKMLANNLGLADDAGDYKHLLKTIAQLEESKAIEVTAAGNIALPQPEAEVLEGTFSANPRGFGFVRIGENEPDVFVKRGNTKFAMNEDVVEVKITSPANPLKGNEAEGKVVAIKSRAVTSLVGEFYAFDEEEKKNSGSLLGYVVNKNKKIPFRTNISKKGLHPEVGDIVRVDITHYPDRDFPEVLQGLVTEIIGKATDTGIDVLEVLESLGIPSPFPEDVIAEANAVPDEIEEKDIIDRVDYRDEITFTIDGADAKDLDDAVHIKALDNGNIELGVHIADVSYYVTEGSALDREALNRGTSTYVTDRVVPMLPERLSNGICSLNPRVNRFTQSCVMEINPDGHVVNYKISQSVIKTTERMTYSDVNEMLAGNQEFLEKFAVIAESVEQMAKLHAILLGMRARRGSIDFETQEAKIIVDKLGKPIEIQVRKRGTAEMMIESFMLIANETVARSFATRELPFIYRVHEHPKADKLTRFIDFASVFGIPLKGTPEKMQSKDLQDFMLQIKGQPGEIVLSTMLLRSMQQARYDEDNLGHFGLAAEYYTHFTSPIRRYPDLLVHRLIRAESHPTTEVIEHFEEIIPEVAKLTSSRERRAIDAERAVEAMKKAEYMESYVGTEYDVTISSVTRFGFFVSLPNTIEGLVHMSTLGDDFYNFNERDLTLKGERTGKVFRMGQPVKVKLVKADKITGDIDFEHVDSDLDVVEAVEKRSRESRGGRDSRDKRPDWKKNKDKDKKPFHKKGGKPARKK